LAGRGLRTGFSTGSAATAAAVAALDFLLAGRASEKVRIELPLGGDLTVTVNRVRSESDREAVAVVVKDAGDDPDVTNRAEIQARVTLMPDGPDLETIVIQGGAGVGRVTRPGLAVPPGEAAINPTPRQMIAENLRRIWRDGRPNGGPLRVEVEISVPQGEKLARRTLNARLGIVGGISILGTTGLVKPFSHEAYTATIEAGLDVARAGGLDEVVLTTDGKSEKAAMRIRPHLPELGFVQIADYFGFALRETAARRFGKVGLVSFFGKAVKQAQGLEYTHAHKAPLDLSRLSGWLDEAGAGPALVEEVASANTARQALDILRGSGALVLVRVVGRRMLDSCRGFAGPGPEIWVKIMDYDMTVIYEGPEEKEQV